MMFKNLTASLLVFAGAAIASNAFGAAEAPAAAYRPPQLSEPDNWTMVVIPDTQNYVKNSRNQGILDLMLTWTAENAEPLRIQQVLVVGDLVDQNRDPNHYPGRNNQNGDEQWQAFSTLLQRLDGKLPYILCTGNHDYGDKDAIDRQTQFPTYFTPDRNPAWRGILPACGPDSMGDETLANACYEFTTPAGQKLLVVSVAFSPTDAELAWAKAQLDRPEYRDHFAIILTHAYLGSDGKRLTGRGYPVDKDGNVGEDIWNKLVKVTPNIRLVICGHISSPDDWDGCTAYSTDRNDAGRTVGQLLFDPQALGGGWHGNGGDGWLRLLEFSPDLKTIKVRTFSPLFAASPATRQLAWQQEPFNEFEIRFED